MRMRMNGKAENNTNNKINKWIEQHENSSEQMCTPYIRIFSLSVLSRSIPLISHSIHSHWSLSRFFPSFRLLPVAVVVVVIFQFGKRNRFRSGVFGPTIYFLFHLLLQIGRVSYSLLLLLLFLCLFLCLLPLSSEFLDQCGCLCRIAVVGSVISLPTQCVCVCFGFYLLSFQPLDLKRKREILFLVPSNKHKH